MVAELFTTHLLLLYVAGTRTGTCVRLGARDGDPRGIFFTIHNA